MLTPKADKGEELAQWLLGEARPLEMVALVESLARRFIQSGVPVDRMALGGRVINPSILAAAFVWQPSGIRLTRYEYEQRDSGAYERSPYKRAYDTKQWVDLTLSETPDDAFGIVPELKEEGITQYICIPLPTSANELMSLTLATRAPEGFDPAARDIITKVIPPLAANVEIKMLRMTFQGVLTAYVGRGPAAQIMGGTIHRGEVTTVRAAILVADLRGFTRLSTQLPPEATADVINRYYDVVVPPVEERGGEVLKFIGDAILAIFPAQSLGEDGAALAALDAARAALGQTIEPFEVEGQRVSIQFGVALHMGEAVFGNVGSGDRLDFTIIGKDVNIAARIATLCSRLGRSFLVSAPVAEVARRHDQVMTSADKHEVRGIEAPMEVFVPAGAPIGPHEDDGISQGTWLAPTVT